MTLLRPSLVVAALLAAAGLDTRASAGGASPPPTPPAVVINEVDPDQGGIDAREFIELHAQGVVDLSHLFLVLYNGADAQRRAYDAVDLYGMATTTDGLFVVGSADLPATDLVAFSVNGLQNGLDAVALWYLPSASAAAFVGTPAGAPPAGAVLVDALVYGRPGSDDALLAALAPAAGIVDESAGGSPGNHSLQRLPDGGQAFETSPIVATDPTPGTLNGRPVQASIHDIQGAGHVSPLRGSFVEGVVGIVTSVGADRCTLQSVPGSEDGDLATSEGLEVFTAQAARPKVGDVLRVGGWVEEHVPGGADENLATTRLRAVDGWELLAAGQPLPAPVILGKGGRILPDRVIDDDVDGQVGDATGLFEPHADGLDFYESLESTHVQVRGARAVGPTSDFGEIPVVGDRGLLATNLGRRGALIRVPGDDQPERIHVDDTLQPTPRVSLGDGFDGPLTGVLGYSFGNFKLQLTEPVRGLPEGPALEALPPASSDELRVASFNVENLAMTSSPRRIRALAEHVVAGLGAPDVLALQEIQDDSGPFDDGVVSAAGTLGALVAAIAAAGGPPYEAFAIDPEDGRDGGQPGGNIRVAYLVRSDRQVEVVLRPGGTASAAATVARDAKGQLQLDPSPGRVEPLHFSWDKSRKPLALELRWQGETLFLVAVHLASKGGDTPLFGSFQPPLLGSAVKRRAQVEVVHAFVAGILDLDPGASVVVLGDFNDFAGSAPLAVLETDPRLHNLTARLAFDDRYTYVYQGTAQVLDHVFVSAGLLGAAGTLVYDVVHRCAERVDGASDHEPIVLTIGLAPRGDGEAALQRLR